jgi:hypothetical protein
LIKVMSVGRRFTGTCLAWLAVALLAAPAWAAPAGNTAASLDFPNLLDRHLRAMRPVADAFAKQTLRIDLLEGGDERNEHISVYWQNGRFRQEYNWLGFTEVFGCDGQQHWYGSNINLPYGMDYEAPADITGQLAAYFAYLTPKWQGYLTAPGDVPFGYADHYAVLRFAPPQISEVLLLLDPADFRLSGILEGNEKTIAGSVVYKLVLLDEWSDYGVCWYPAVTRTITLDADGKQQRERMCTTQSLTTVSALADTQFTPASAPPVDFPSVPPEGFEAKFSYLNDSVVLRCQTADGTALRLELDSGANVGLLRRDVAAKLGVQLLGDEQVTGHGGTAQVQYGRVEGLRVEGMHRGQLLGLPAYPAAVLAEGGGLDNSLADNGVAGLLGSFILNSFVVKLDYRRRVITFYDPRTFEPQQLGGGYHAIPVTRDSMPFVDVVVDGKIKGGAFFNTGAQQFFALQAWACDAAGITYDVETIGTGITIDGYTAFGIIRPKVVQLGDIIIESPTTHLEVLAPGEPPNPKRIASFGGAFFERYALTFDLYHQQYYIQGAGLPKDG